jgi:transposase
LPANRGRVAQPHRLPPASGSEDPARKKIPETDAIFRNVQAARDESATDSDRLRISIDTKAKVKIGEFSRHGETRAAQALKAVDHDMSPEALLVPLGILELNRGTKAIHQPMFVFGHSKETSDFIADGLELWWTERSAFHPGVRCLHIELDNGPEIASSRTQFMKRLVEFVDRHRIAIELTYLPPYHSKYNPIERCWGILEQHWNGTLLDSVERALRWAGTMTWRTISPLIREITAAYERGIRISKTAFRPIAERLIRSETLPKWSLRIQPG